MQNTVLVQCIGLNNMKQVSTTTELQGDLEQDSYTANKTWGCWLEVQQLATYVIRSWNLNNFFFTETSTCKIEEQ